jgi:hypothetical protein
MGGFGSGRWRGHSKKTTVEECHRLDILRLGQAGILRAAMAGTKGVWHEFSQSKVIAALTYVLDTTDMDCPWLQLSYQLSRTHEAFEYAIALQTTRLHSGGRRWWFTCPLITRGRACERRVGKLYLPPGARYYGCRHCYDLTYTSCQESHLYDRGFAQLAAGMSGTSGAELRRLLRERYLYGTV